MTLFSSEIVELLSLLVRWLHVITGIAWIGASFYFNWLEGQLNRQNQPVDLAGDLWAVHGGGFYHVQKLKKYPVPLPQHLHWFKYEAYFTWITGVLLLGLIYHAQASGFLLAPDKSDLSPGTVHGISVASLILPWLIYHFGCSKTKLSQTPLLLAGLLFGFFAALYAALDQVMAGRAALLHLGASIGTLMAANVFFVIIPSQKILVAAAEGSEFKGGEEKALALAKQAQLRSLHNNYFTLPVILLMISHHYPAFFAPPAHIFTVALVSLGAVMVRHGFNLRNRHQGFLLWVWVGALIVTVSLLGGRELSKQARSASALTAPSPKINPNFLEMGKKESRSEIEIAAIIDRRCRTCHSRQPSDDIFVVAPGEVFFDSLEEVASRSTAVLDRVYVSQTMPLANKTRMTPGERSKLAGWLKSIEHK